MSPTIAAITVLTDLVDTARSLTRKAVAQRRHGLAARLRIIALQLDAARTTLVQEGAEYIPTAWAYIDTARYQISTWQVVLT